jgi:phage tail-like protein
MLSLGANAAFAAVTNLLGIRNDPYMGFNFLIEIQGLLVGAFSEVSGLQGEVEVHDYREGGQNQYVHKFVGPTKYSTNLTLKHGVTDLDFLWSWYNDVSQSIENGEPVERRNGSIFLLDRHRIPAMWWNFEQAYPVKWTGPELNASSNAVAAESVELVHKGIIKPDASRVLSAMRAAAGVSLDVGASISF